MLIAFDVVQHERHTLPRRQLRDRAIQHNSIQGTGQGEIRDGKLVVKSFIAIRPRRALKWQLAGSFFAQMHKHGIECHAVYPCRKGGFAAEIANLSVNLKKRLLSQFFGGGDS